MYRNTKIDISQIVKFGLVGAGATGIHYGVYVLLMRIATYNVAYTLGYVISFGFNFVASNYFTFQVKPTVQRGSRFVLAHVSNYLIQMIVLNGIMRIGIKANIAPIIVFAISIPINFFMVKKALK